MSQDELAEKLQVTRQSISLWETGQTQPSLDNIVALAKLFDISTDALLTDSETKSPDTDLPVSQPEKTARKKSFIITVVCLVAVSVLVLSVFLLKGEDSVSGEHNAEPVDSSKNDYVQNEADNASTVPEKTQGEEKAQSSESEMMENVAVIPENNREGEDSVSGEHNAEPVDSSKNDYVQNEANDVSTAPEKTQGEEKAQSSEPEMMENVAVIPENSREMDLYGYLKDFVVQNGTLNGDYCYYTKSADNYGGYASENFSLYYWGDTDTIEFCLHSVLDETFSINFYLLVPKTQTGNYEYISSYYFRDNGEPLYEARGTIEAGKFTVNYPLTCTKYIGPAEAQNDFMEISRQGICDLIDCLEDFITVENLEYSFADFGFIKF